MRMPCAPAEAQASPPQGVGTEAGAAGDVHCALQRSQTLISSLPGPRACTMSGEHELCMPPPMQGSPVQAWTVSPSIGPGRTSRSRPGSHTQQYWTVGEAMIRPESPVDRQAKIAAPAYPDDWCIEVSNLLRPYWQIIAVVMLWRAHTPSGVLPPCQPNRSFDFCLLLEETLGGLHTITVPLGIDGRQYITVQQDPSQEPRIQNMYCCINAV